MVPFSTCDSDSVELLSVVLDEIVDDDTDVMDGLTVVVDDGVDVWFRLSMLNHVKSLLGAVLSLGFLELFS